MQPPASRLPHVCSKLPPRRSRRPIVRVKGHACARADTACLKSLAKPSDEIHYCKIAIERTEWLDDPTRFEVYYLVSSPAVCTTVSAADKVDVRSDSGRDSSTNDIYTVNTLYGVMLRCELRTLGCAADQQINHQISCGHYHSGKEQRSAQSSTKIFPRGIGALAILSDFRELPGFCNEFRCS